MINRIIHDKEIAQLQSYLDEYDNIVITCHVSPDGDAIGASLGLYHLLSSMGKTVKIITPDQVYGSLKFLPGSREIIAYSKYTELSTQILRRAQLIFCLDFNALYRVDKMKEELGNATGKKVLIDHHLDAEHFCDLSISYPIMSSTCELLFRVIYLLGLYDQMNKACAECIYTGMMTDTGNFSYNSNRADLYIIIAKLIEKGIDKDKIYTLAMNSSTEDRLRLIGYSVYKKMRVFPDVCGALITLTQDELSRFNYKKGDTESLVNVPLGIPEVRWVVFMREENDYIKVSARSKGDFAVNKMCERYFNGGGHKNASGGEFRGTLEEAETTFMQIVENLKNNNITS